MMRIVPLISVVIASSVAAAGDPAWPGHHPLTQAEVGSLLISELRCAACHTGLANESVPEKTAPDLAEVGSRISPEYLQRFLASPLVTHPGTEMPDMLAARSESERRAIAQSLTHFLIARSKSAGPAKPIGPIDRQLGKELYHSVGCVACHGPKETIANAQQSAHDQDEDADVDDEVEEDESEPDASSTRTKIKPEKITLEHVATKYDVQALSDFLFQPLRVRSSGRMPDMKLTPDESLAIAGYLIGDKSLPSATLVPDAALVKEGEKHFRALNCAVCHAMPGIEATKSVALLKPAKLNGGCLSDAKDRNASDTSPRFDLDAGQVAAIAAAIRSELSPDSDQVALAKTLTAFRCIACHVRDDYGGVHDAHKPFFKGSELNLGDDGRIPPPLTLMGAKLQPAWLKKVLFDGESVRHYMSTRMPQYGVSNLQHVPDLFRRLDVLEGPEMKIPSPESPNEAERQQEKLLRAAGRELLGDKGANCVACHNFNGKAANVNQGIDLLTSYERLQPAWFHSYLQRPGAYRPRTVMPSAWPDGKAVFTNILEGDTDRQIEAIWYYLSLGTSAADPSGVRSVSTKLAVSSQASIHRGRSRVAGFRGIAVGLPEKISYAFNAETGTLSAIWLGEFVHVNWSGQGSGDFHPSSEPIQLAQDVSFASLGDENDSWPLLPVMTKEAPTNPDPLYPKNVGYQFRGYHLDELAIPTFQYRSGTVDIEDRSTAIIHDQRRLIKRVLQFDSPKRQTVWFRALVGDISRESDLVFRSGRLRLTVPVTDVKLRATSGEPQQTELLLRLEIPQGKSTLELQYEPLDK